MPGCGGGVCAIGRVRVNLYGPTDGRSRFVIALTSRVHERFSACHDAPSALGVGCFSSSSGLASSLRSRLSGMSWFVQRAVSLRVLSALKSFCGSSSALPGTGLSVCSASARSAARRCTRCRG